MSRNKIYSTYRIMICILDSNHMYQMLSYDSLTKIQKLSIKSTEALLNTCFYRSKYFLNIMI